MDEQRIKQVDNQIFYVLLIVLACTPLIIAKRDRIMYSPWISDLANISTSIKVDYFTYYKMLFLIAMTGLLVTLLVWKVFYLKTPLTKSPLHKWLLLLALSMAVSTALSENAYHAIWGHYNRSEGAITYSCYLLLLFSATQIKLPKNTVGYVGIAFVPMIIMNFLIVTCTLWNFNLLNLSVVRTLLLIPQTMYFSVDSLLIGTLNQENYVSGFFVMMIGFYLSALLFEQKRSTKWFYRICLVLCMYIVLLSKSNIGFLTVVCIVLALSVYSLIIHQKRLLAKLAIFSGLFFAMAQGLSLIDQKVGDESYRFITQQQQQNDYNFGKNFTPTEATTYDEFVLPLLPNKATSALSSRAYIWEKSFDLIEEKPWFGYGLDTFLYHFPHFNLDARAGISTERIIVDKPHSSYLDLLFGVGLVGFMMVVIIIGYFFKVVILQIRKQKMIRHLPIVMLLVAFGIQGITVDTNVGTSVVFWIMLGLYFSLIEQEERFV